VGAAGDPDPPVGVQVLLDQPVQLTQQHLGVDHHTGPDDRGDVRVEDPAGDQVQLEDAVTDDDGVAGVVAALVADHQVGGVGEQVGRLALALVAPLGADDHGRWHGRVLRSWPPGRTWSCRGSR
jgi:hypothetical protein